MTRQAQVGVFALLALLLLFGIFYVITDFGTRHSGYRVGVRFVSAAGLQSGALVYFSGVTVGSVDSILLQPDNTVDVILAISSDVNIPRTSEFLIQAPLTGSPNMVIVPPKPIPGVLPQPADMLERRVLPVADQPQGRNPATLADLLDQGQGEVKRLDAMLADVQRREPRMLDSLQSTLDNANALTATAQASISTLAQQTEGIAATLQTSVNANSPKLDRILTQFDQMSVALNKSSQSLEELATNKQLKGSLVATAKNIQQTTQTISELTQDLRTITGDPNTQAQLKNTVANLDAASQRTASLLGRFGGTSCVYGVDACATPAPAASGETSGQTLPLGSPYPPAPYPSAGTSATLPPHLQGTFRAGLASVMKNLVAIQLRESFLNGQTWCCQNPLLGHDRGPQTDLNAIFLPNGGTSVLLGVNDLGYNTTWNAAVLRRVRPDVRIGGGVLYGQLGVIGQYNARTFGLEGRLYDPRYAMLDLYGNLRMSSGISLYLGERDTLHAERRTVYGLQLQY
jgi:phospholipid/cholesterol/gamma-HCH transport system substrate-binding protein